MSDPLSFLMRLEIAVIERTTSPTLTTLTTLPPGLGGIFGSCSSRFTLLQKVNYSCFHQREVNESSKKKKKMLPRERQRDRDERERDTHTHTHTHTEERERE